MYYSKYTPLILLTGIIWANPLFAELDLSISVDPPSSEVVVGNGLDYVVKVKNLGEDAVTNAQIRYTFSQPMDIGVITGGTCADKICTLDELGAKDTATDTATITIPITVPNTALNVADNAITLEVSDVADGNNKADNDAISILKPELSILVIPSTHKIVAGQQLSYELAVTNDNETNGANASGVKIEYEFPDIAVEIGTMTGAGWTCDTATCTLASNLEAGATKNITLPVTVPNTATGPLKIIATAKADNALDDVMEKSIEIFPAEADLSITQTVSDEAVIKDGNFRYNLVVSNAGPDVADNVSVTIDLLGNSEYVSAIGDWDCSNVGQTITCHLASLANGADSALSIEVKGESGLLSNDAEVGSEALDPDETNNASTSQEVVVFTYGISPKTGVAGDEVTLKANSEVAGLSFAWQYKEQCIVGENTEVDISSPGISLISLTVINGEIDENTCELANDARVIKRVEEQVVLETNIPPAAQLKITPQSLEQPGTVTLDASQSTDSRNEQSDSGIVGYKFSHNGTMIPNDGSWLENATDNLNIEVAGVHTITAFVKDKKGAIGSATSQVIVGDSDRPYAAFDVAPGRMDAPVNVTLQAVQNDAITEYLFTITAPNGSPINVNSNTTLPNITVNFPITGNYRVSLQVVNAKGEISEAIKDIYIGGIKPSSATVTPAKGQEPHTVTLKANPSSDANEFVSCKWTIYDKTETVEKDCFKNTHEFEDMVYIFREAGIYKVDLAISDVNGDISPEGSSEVVVYAPGTPEPTLDITPVIGFSPLTVHARATATDSNPMDKVTFQWTSLGEYSNSKKKKAGNVFEEKTDIKFTGPGEYQVKIRATDNSKASLFAELEQIVTVLAPPEITTTDDIPISCSLLTTNFGVSYSDPHTDNLQYEWSATEGGQPNPVNGPNTFITFPENINSIVTLKVTEKNRRQNEPQVEVTVTKPVSTMCDNVAPIADVAFVTQAVKGFRPFTVRVTGQDSYDPDNTINPLLFRWKADTAHSIASPTATETDITFNTVDTHNIVLEVSDGIATTLSTLKTVEVMAPPQIIASVAEVCPSKSVTFSVPPEQGFSYVWSSDSFPDLNNTTSALTVVATEQSFLMKLQVTDPNGTQVNVNKQITVLPASSAQCTTPVEPVQAVIIQIPKQIQVNERLSVNGRSSTGPIESYAWLTSDGQTCTSNICPFTFTSVGTKNITLTVSGDSGNSHSATVSVEVVAEPIPIKAVILPVPYQIQVNESLSVNGSTSTGPIKNYAWSTSDGQTCTSKICPLTFTSVGTKNITLTVSGDSGTPNSATVSVEVIAKPIPIKAVILPVPTQIRVNESLSVDGSTSTGAIVSYAWATNDDQTCTSQTCNFTFTSVGTKNITLTVSGDSGTPSSATVSVEVIQPTDTLPTVPTIGIADKDLKPDDGSKPTLTLNAGDDPNLIEYKWIIRDKDQKIVGEKYGNKPTLSFDKSGDFTVELVVKDTNGVESEPTVVKTVNVPIQTPPEVPDVKTTHENLAPSDGSKPTLTLDANDNPNIAEYEWTVRNAKGQVVHESHGSKPTFSFDNHGEFTVDLTVKGKNGASNGPKQVKKVTVPIQNGPTPPPIPVVGIDNVKLIPDGNGKTKKEVTLNAGENPDIIEYKWTVTDADGKVVDEEYNNKPTLSLDKPGEFVVDLTVTDKNGLSNGPEQVKKIIGPYIPDIKIVEEHLEPDGKKEVTLGIVGDNPTDVEYEYEWKTSDGQVKSGKTPSFEFTKPGEYFVDFTVKDKSNGAAITAEKVAKITVPNGTITLMKPRYTYSDDANSQETGTIEIEEPDDDTSSQGTGTIEIEEPDDDTSSQGTGTIEIEEPDDDTSSQGTGTIEIEEPDDGTGTTGTEKPIEEPDDSSTTGTIDIGQPNDTEGEILSFQLPNGDEYYPGDNLRVDLNINFHNGIDCTEADLWVAIMLPEALRIGLNISNEFLPLMFFHNNENGDIVWTYYGSVEPAPPEPQRYDVISNSLQDSLTLLNITIPTDNLETTGDERLPDGDYVFYAGLVKNEESPLPNPQLTFCFDSAGEILISEPALVRILR